MSSRCRTTVLVDRPCDRNRRRWRAPSGPTTTAKNQRFLDATTQSQLVEPGGLLPHDNEDQNTLSIDTLATTADSCKTIEG